MLLDFLQNTYEAAAANGHWERERLERAPGRWRPEMAYENTTGR